MKADFERLAEISKEADKASKEGLLTEQRWQGLAEQALEAAKGDKLLIEFMYRLKIQH